MDAPPERETGYLPIEDYGLIGDGRTAALVGRDGSLDWLCLPRFDSDAVFCGLLDAERGGRFVVTVEELRGSSQRYLEDTGVLVTGLHGPDGVAELTDLLTLRRGADLSEDTSPARGGLLRRVRVLSGRVRVRVSLRPRGGATLERRAGGWALDCSQRPDLDLHLFSSRTLDGLESTLELETGEGLDLLLRWDGAGWRSWLTDLDALADATASAWRAWASRIGDHGPRPGDVRRSAVTLKMLDHAESGAIVAAPTSSLPEAVGGVRNWDYRYAWVRDTAFSVHALRRIGLAREADSFLAWVLAAIERDGRAHLMYDLDGSVAPLEREDPDLEGYRGSAPVRWGNGAAEQTQHDVYGEILDCAYQWVGAGGQVDAHLWGKLRWLAEQAATRWRTPDHGIWEVRTAGAPYTYSVAMCQVALDRAARIAARHDLPGGATAWATKAEEVREALLREAWDPRRRTLTEQLGGSPGLDASLLALPLRRVIAYDDPRMVGTVAAVTEQLGAGGGLLHRYDPEVSDDGLPGQEGAFVLCSFWLVDNLAGQGRLDEAGQLYESLCQRANPLGLLSEEIDPSTGAFLGNFPQAFSHLGVISSGIGLARRTAARPSRPPGGSTVDDPAGDGTARSASLW